MQTSAITANDAITAIARAKGDQLLAAERLGVDHYEMIGIIASDPAALSRLTRVLRTITILENARTIDSLHHVLRNASINLDAKEAVTLLTKLTDTQAKLTDPATNRDTQTPNQTTIIQNFLQMLPPDVRTAMATLLPASIEENENPKPADTVIDANPADVREISSSASGMGVQTNGEPSAPLEPSPSPSPSPLNHLIPN